jgi:UDP-galactopyranose mutase
VPNPDLLCYSHLRWDHVFQRPNHLMTRAARERRVFFVEEPSIGGRPRIRLSERPGGVIVASPEIPDGLTEPATVALLRDLLAEFIVQERVDDAVGWYYTAMALPWSGDVAHVATVYDCMDELSAFRGAPARLRDLERTLLTRADVVFTGGHSLYEAKQKLHPNVHAFPSSVDAGHFRRARSARVQPEDQRAIPRPRLGYFGVIDERMDLDLVDAVAKRRPDWQIVLVGPVTKIDRGSLPALPNVHLLGQKSYAELPDYLAGWDVAIMPFARNESTRYISPTKTPEYLAGGKPVVSTPIRDVVQPWGRLGLVAIAGDPGTFVRAVEEALTLDLAAHRERADAALAHLSWDTTWTAMWDLVSDAIARRNAPIRSAQVVTRREVAVPTR